MNPEISFLVFLIMIALSFAVPARDIVDQNSARGGRITGLYK